MVVEVAEAVSPTPNELADETLDDGGTFIHATDDLVLVSGRVDRTTAGSLRFGYPGVTTRLHFVGTSLVARLSSSTGASALDVRVDGRPHGILWVEPDRRDVAVATALPPGAHTVELTHRTETRLGVVEIERFALPDGGRFLEPPSFPKRKLLVIGASVVCGEGVARGPECKPGQPDPASWDARASFGMLTGQALGAEVNLVCYGGRGMVRDWRGDREVLNAPEFFELAVPDDETLTLWDHTSFQPDAILIALGNNDLNSDLPTAPAREEFVETYVSFARRLLELYPDAHLWLSDGPMVRDEAAELVQRKTLLQGYLREAVARLASDRVHFLAAAEQPGDACDAHPTREQHQAMAGELISELRRVLEW